MTIERGQIYYCNLSGTEGSEQGNYRPVVIIQNNIGNRYAPTTIIAPLTSQTKNNLPTHVFTKTDNGVIGTILLEQVRTVDKKRLDKYMGKVSDEVLQKIDKAIMASFGISQL